MTQTDSAHLTDAQLLAAIHAEPTAEVEMITAHTDACPRCALRQQELIDQDAEIASLLGNLDPPTQAAAVPAYRLRRQSRWAGRGVRVAAAAATVAIAAAAIVVPASPVHRWLLADRQPPQPDSVTAPRAAAASGIAISPPASLVIVLRNPQQRGAFEIIRTAAGDVAFRTQGGDAAYQVASDRVAIDNTAPADLYQVDLPAAVRQLRILVGDRVLVRWPEDSASYASSARGSHFRIPIARGGNHGP